MIEAALARLPRRAALATRHGKERWIAPALAELGLECVVAPVDTDRFGTFSGETPRALAPEPTVLAKAAAALAAVPDAGWGVATEATFGPHPQAAWLTVHEERVALVARDRSEELVARVVRLANARRARVTDAEEGVARALDWGFPEHGVIVVAEGPDGAAPARGVEKEARTPDALAAGIRRIGPPVWLTSDLRAHRHPPRAEVLAAAVAELVARARRLPRVRQGRVRRDRPRPGAAVRRVRGADGGAARAAGRVSPLLVRAVRAHHRPRRRSRSLPRVQSMMRTRGRGAPTA